MKALSLFSGIGGIDLACEWAGIETVAFCEREPFPQKVLRKHWPHVPIYDDVCTLTKERLDADGIGPIDIILSGDPCQPYSQSGERKGEDDDRFLWPEVDRLLETIRPRWVLRENVAGNITLGLDGVLADLERHGYTWQSFVIPSAAVGAFHRRDRVFVVANLNSIRMNTEEHEVVE
ncbi:DNA cytosine methyltransferase [Cohnella nanjingensis]|uniref:DNA (cytosine-5-)-methyltransferase n=1 Tax=Cohnella nanjingensis TaxID=1387779 RepID=A0A7X0RU99_9BACL|nr:DNA cytosine methyltransferase [Cohnella nanjingensis]MBB6672601.1 DNA cytosine methyltransferase [Cohnella nanjingensis]